MKKPLPNISATEPRDGYDFSSGVRGKCARRYAEGANLVLLEPDVAKVFPTAQSVNRSLRGLISTPLARRRLAVKAR